MRNQGRSSSMAAKVGMHFPTLALLLGLLALERILLKIGGTALYGAAPQNVDPKVVMLIAREVEVASHYGVEVAIMVGGQNIFCGDNRH